MTRARNYAGVRVDLARALSDREREVVLEAVSHAVLVRPDYNPSLLVAAVRILKSLDTHAPTVEMLERAMLDQATR